MMSAEIEKLAQLLYESSVDAYIQVTGLSPFSSWDTQLGPIKAIYHKQAEYLLSKGVKVD